MDRLRLYEGYTRKDINSIFNPQTPFTPGAGIYGMHGLIRVPKSDGSQDFIFFVTIGHNRTGYEFTEDISKDGELRWQSQPSQTLDNDRIIQLINHDENKDNIFLFIRHGKHLSEYIYLGTLAYVNHDTQREKPVHFVWQIMEWSQYAIDKLHEIGIDVIQNINSSNPNDEELNLVEVNPPEFKKKENAPVPVNESNNNLKHKPDYVAMQKKATRIGEAGEQLVLNYERNYLIAQNLPELADKVIKISDTNDKVGYDILSYDIYGNKKMIEVKTTSGGINLGFFISSNEVKVSKAYSDNYYIYRVFDYNEKNNTGKFYIAKGFVEEKFGLSPTEFKAEYKG